MNDWPRALAMGSSAEPTAPGALLITEGNPMRDYPEPPARRKKRTPMTSPSFSICTITTVRETTAPAPDALRGSDAAAAFIRQTFPMLAADPREHFLAVYTNIRRVPIAAHIISIGSAHASIVHPSMVYGPALLHNAASVIVAHNHPSGDPSPSAEDWSVTERLRRAGELLGIELTDHIIIAGDTHRSLRDESAWR